MLKLGNQAYITFLSLLGGHLGFQDLFTHPALAPDNTEVHVVFPIMVVSASVISVAAVLSASNSTSRAAVSAACLLRASAVAIVFASKVKIKNPLLYIPMEDLTSSPLCKCVRIRCRRLEAALFLSVSMLESNTLAANLL